MDEGSGGDDGADAPVSELSKLSQLHHAAIQEVAPENDRDRLEDTDVEELGPTFLVGKLVRLYCPADNTYHTGRIVDWRAASIAHFDSNIASVDGWGGQRREDLFFGDGEIAATEFLVRFAAGTEGRKVPLLRWLILEEHSLAVGAAVIWGQLRKGRGLSGWRPAQTLARTSLELVPVRHLLEGDEGSELFALATFFGEESHVYLRLRDEAVDFFSPTFVARRQGRAQASSSGKNCPPPAGNQLDTSVSLALLELEEQKRAHLWHTLPIQNSAHNRAITIKDENSLPQLVLPGRKTESIRCVKRGNDGLFMSEKNDDKPRNRPKLCPLIEHGLDRIWLARLLGGSGMKSVDALESIRVQSVGSGPEAVAMLQNLSGGSVSHAKEEFCDELG